MLNNADVESYWDNVSLLIPFDNDFVDVKNGLGTTTINGTPTITNNQYEVKYGKGAATFNGTSDILRYQQGSNTTIGTGDFTIEFWAYATRFGQTGGGATSSTIRGIFSNHTILSTAASSRTLILRLDNDQLYLQIGGIALGAAGTMYLNIWHHIAVVRTGATLSLYLDGTLIHAYQSADYDFSTNTFMLGGANFSSTSSFGYFPGYIDDFRFTIGIGRYTEDFTPPSQAYSIGNTVRSPVNFFPQVRLIASEGLDNQSISGDELNNRRFPPSLSLTQPFIDGNESYYFYKNGITTFPSDEYQLGINDFTLESWVYITESSSTKTIFSSYGYPARNNFNFYISGNRLIVAIGQASTTRLDGSQNASVFYNTVSKTVPINQWAHVAWTRKGTTNRVFLDGEQVATFNNQTNWSSKVLTIGHYARVGYVTVGQNSSLGTSQVLKYREAGFFSGYMNDIQVSNLVSKYNTNFEVPNNFNKRLFQLSTFDDNQLPANSFDDRILERIETDQLTNNNIFWFNDNNGFVLQKMDSLENGINISNMELNSSNELIVTLSNSQVYNLGNMFLNTLENIEVNGTGYLVSKVGLVYNFIELLSTNLALLNVSPSEVLLTSSTMYDRGYSYNSYATVSSTFLEGESYNAAPALNTWYNLELNTIGYNSIDLKLENNEITLNPGMYLINGISVFFGGVILQIVDENDIVLANSYTTKSTNLNTVATQTNLLLSLQKETKIRIRVLCPTSAEISLVSITGTISNPFHTYTFYKVS